MICYLYFMKRTVLFINLCAAFFFSCENKTNQKQDDKPLANNTATIKPADGPIKLLWIAEQYDSQFKMNVPTIQLNKSYLQNMNEAEKAIVAYYATFHGNECWWDNDKPNDDRSNLKCVLISALNLGYQCSDTHLNFIRKWYSNQPELLNELEYCPTIPNTSTLQDAFEDIYVERRGDYFTIRFNICAVNLRENLTRCYEEIHTYRILPTSVEIVKNTLS